MKKINQQAIEILRYLLADLFDQNESRLGMMKSDIVTSDMIPDELAFEKAVMEGFERCDEKGEPPTPENVALMSMSRDQNILEKVYELYELHNEVPRIRANAVWFRNWSQQELLGKAASKISELAKMDYADVSEKQGMMLDELISVPIDNTRQSFTRLEIIENLEQEQYKRVQARDKGQALGGILPLYGLREAIPVLSAGDLTLWTGAPKSGKTTWGMLLAEMNAIENDIDVLWLLTETSPRTIEERFEARDLMVPGWALRSGMVDYNKEPFKTKHLRYIEQQREYWENYGHIHLQYVAGSRMSEIASQIRIHKRLADTRNRPLLVIIDYLQRIHKQSNKSEVEAIAQISNLIKDLAVRYDCHIVLFSQESFSSEGKLVGDSRAHGSNTPIFVAQVHLATRVLNCVEDIAVTDSNGNIVNNAVGRERYWQKSGRNKRQSVVRLDVLRANDNDTDNVFCAFENELFIMYDCSDPNLPLAPFMNDDIATFSEDMHNSSRRLI